MNRLHNYVLGDWHDGTGDEHTAHDATSGAPVATMSSKGLDFAAIMAFARDSGGPSLRALTFPQRGELLKSLALALNEHLDHFYDIAASYGATRKEAWSDIEGGIGVLFSYSSVGRKQLPDRTFLLDGEMIGLSKDGGFAGQHLHVSREGVLLQINAYNFPAWGMLEKLAPALLAGLPVVVKPAPQSAWLAQAMVHVIADSGLLPDGALQLVLGGPESLLAHLTAQDVVAFTGSSATAANVRTHPQVVASGARLNIETDSLNVAILGPDAAPDSAAFKRFVKDVAFEMTYKAGQRCTAMRRVLVPPALHDAVVEGITGRLATTTVGNPRRDDVRMGALVDHAARDRAQAGVKDLLADSEVVFGDPDGGEFLGVDGDSGAFMGPVLLYASDPHNAVSVHHTEVFGPVATLMPYTDNADAIALARLGNGGLVASLYTNDTAMAREVTLGLAPHHGRVMVIDDAAAAESTGHGTVMPQLVHGGPGRAGGGEELGGIRSVLHLMQRVAIQGHPERLKDIAGA